MRTPSRTRLQALRTAMIMMAAATTIATTGCAARQEVALRDDVAITKDVQDRLGADPSSKGSQIVVETKTGIVQLTGTVTTDVVRNSAERIARDTPGVRSVDNDMRFSAGDAPVAN